MAKRKAPELSRGRKNNEAGQASSVKAVYITPLSPASESCTTCLYYRFIQTAKLNRVVCAFTGEKIASGWWCSFWTAANGEVLEW